MPIREPLADPFFAKMCAALRGSAGPWREVNEALRDAVVDHAMRRVPFYREVGRPGAPFDELPVMTKDLVRREGERLLAEGVPRDRRVDLRTSGSSGQPLAFSRDTAQGPMEHVSARRFLRRLQGLPDDATTVWVSARPQPEPGSWPTGLAGLVARLAKRGPPPRVIAVPTHTLEPRIVPGLVDRWKELASFVLYGYASALGWIAAEVERQGLGPVPPPTAVVTTGDTLTPQVAERLRGTLGAPVHSWYGSNEVNGFVAGTLPGTRRYVVNPLLVHLEVLDDRDRPTAPGEHGRIVLTDLNNYVMPLIRYDTQDVGVASSESHGGLPVLDEIVGRGSETLRLPSGRIVSPLTLGMRLFVGEDFVPYIRGYQCAEIAPNSLQLRVVWEGGDPGPEVRAAIVRSVREITDPDTVVEVVEVADLERLPSGKSWIVRREYDGGSAR